MTFPIVYRRTTIRAEVWPNGTFRRAYVGMETDITELLTSEQREEIAAMVREEMEDD